MNKWMKESMRWYGKHKRHMVPFICSGAFIKYPSNEEEKSRTHHMPHTDDDGEKD